VRRRRAALAAAALAAACASHRPPPASVVAEARASPAYSATLRVSLRGPDLRGRTRALLAFRRPDALRIEIPGPTGARMIAVAHGPRLVAVFPAERAVWRGHASEAEMDALFGIALAPAELMDLLVGAGSPRLRAYEVRWGAALPRRIDATLPDGARLRAEVDSAETRTDLAPAAFEEPNSSGFREVGTQEARRLLGIRS
jgi:hypothetical protein